MTGPIKPSDVVVAKATSIPQLVFEACNELIVENIGAGGTARFTLKDLVERVMSKSPPFGRPELFERGWLDVESSYRAAGWTVTFDKPGYNETYEANFTFGAKP